MDVQILMNFPFSWRIMPGIFTFHMTLEGKGAGIFFLNLLTFWMPCGPFQRLRPWIDLLKDDRI
jgi:hypothetical protein